MGFNRPQHLPMIGLLCNLTLLGQSYTPLHQEQFSSSYPQWEMDAASMVSQQIENRGITDVQLLNVMRKTPRHCFIPIPYKKHAYNDHVLPIGKNQTISQPFIVALMTQALDVKPIHKVLEIGTGSGYQAAILSPLVQFVYSIEILQTLADRADSTLKYLGYKNIIVRWGDGYDGWPEQAPFDRIIVTAAPPKIPEALIEQLKPNGKMILPVGSVWQELVIVVKKENGEIFKKSVIPVRFVPMIHPD